MYLKYACDNPECEDQGIIRDVRPDLSEDGGSSECPSCGWFMTAVE